MSNPEAVKRPNSNEANQATKHRRLSDMSNNDIYYFVSISYPFIAKSYTKKDQYMEIAKKVFKGINRSVDGDFILINQHSTDLYYFFSFATSVPANGATRNNFACTYRDVPTDTILPPTPKEVVVVDLRLYGADQLMGITSRDPLPEPEVSFPEDALNILLCHQISKYVVQRGYVCHTNKSEAGESLISRGSIYFRSRPDIFLYNPSKLKCAAVILVNEPERSAEGGEGGNTIRGGITESLTKVRKDKQGQLLAGMEKVAADIACESIRRNFQFTNIKMLGLIIDLHTEMCEVYELNMDLVGRQSELMIGQLNLPIKDAINRMIIALESQNSTT